MEPYTPDLYVLPPVLAPDPVSETPREQPSATGRSTVPADEPGYNTLVDHILHTNVLIGNNPNQPRASTFTRIDIGRIRAGLDVRTTVSCNAIQIFGKVSLIISRSCFATFQTALSFLS